MYNNVDFCWMMMKVLLRLKAQLSKSNCFYVLSPVISVCLKDAFWSELLIPELNPIMMIQMLRVNRETGKLSASPVYLIYRGKGASFITNAQITSFG